MRIEHVSFDYDSVEVHVVGDNLHLHHNFLVVEGTMFWTYEGKIEYGMSEAIYRYKMPTFPSIDFPLRAGMRMYFMLGPLMHDFTLKDLEE